MVEQRTLDEDVGLLLRNGGWLDAYSRSRQPNLDIQSRTRSGNGQCSVQHAWPFVTARSDLARTTAPR
jgi:hypothetical protein